MNDAYFEHSRPSPKGFDRFTEVDAALREIETRFATRKEATAAPESIFGEIETTTDALLERMIGAAEEPSDIVDRLRARRSNLSLTSDINSEIVGVCKQILTFGAAGFGLSVGFSDKLVLLHPNLQKSIVITGISYLELMMVSIVVLIYYLLQARFRYPFLHFRLIGNAWPYFYYASISPEVPRSPLQLPGTVRKGAKFYATDLIHFADRTIFESKPHELRNELQQYFLLLSFQGYLNQFSLKLTNLFLYGLIGTGATTVALALWAAAS
jgi:hypothetical protein